MAHVADQSEAGICSDHAASDGPPCQAYVQPVVLREALDQYYREAQRGVCDTGRYRCQYFIWGKGPPLVFVPGICDEALSFVLPIARLKNQFRCIAFDLPGSPGDGAKVAGYRHVDYIADLLALVDHLQLGKTYLLGSSFGSTVVLGALHRQPERFSRAILQGGFARRPLAFAEELLASWGRYFRGNMAALPFREQVMKINHELPFRLRQPENWNFYLQRSSSPPMGTVARRALILHRLDLRPILPLIRQPVLLICGDSDPLVGKACEKELLEGLPVASRAELENCGHLPQYSHPEIMAEVVSRFLRPGDAITV